MEVSAGCHGPKNHLQHRHLKDDLSIKQIKEYIEQERIKEFFQGPL